MTVIVFEIGSVQLLELSARSTLYEICLLYTSDAADERSSVDLGGRRIIKKKTIDSISDWAIHNNKQAITETYEQYIKTKEEDTEY